MAETTAKTEPTKEKQKFITGKGNWYGAAPEKRKASWRYDESTGKYNDKPLDKNYFKDYFKTVGAVKFECPLCGRSVQRSNLSHHKKHNYAKNTALAK
jgi:hypothetical protein